MSFLGGNYRRALPLRSDDGRVRVPKGAGGTLPPALLSDYGSAAKVMKAYDQLPPVKALKCVPSNV